MTRQLNKVLYGPPSSSSTTQREGGQPESNQLSRNESEASEIKLAREAETLTFE